MADPKKPAKKKTNYQGTGYQINYGLGGEMGAGIRPGAIKQRATSGPVYAPKTVAKNSTPWNSKSAGFDMADDDKYRTVADTRARNYVADTYGTPASDPLNGTNWMDLLAGFGLNANNGGGGGGRGGGSSGPSAAEIAAQQAQMSAAYKQMLAALDQGFNDQNGLIQGQIGQLGTQFDQRGQSLTDMFGQSNTRLDQILAELNGGIAPVRQAVAGAWQGADARQAALAQELAASSQGRTQGAQQTLGMFGGAPAQVEQNYGPQDLIGMQRASMASLAGSQDAGLAARPAIYNGLQADVSTRNSQQLTAMQAQLQQQRAAQMAALQAQQVQAQMQAAQQRAQLAMQAAKDGVTF